MTANQFRAALERLSWSQEAATQYLGICNRQRVSEWCRSARPVPDYIAAHLEYRLAISDAKRRGLIAFAVNV